MGLFLGSHGELRTGWKLAAFIVVLLPMWVGIGFALTLASTVAFGDLDELHRIELNVLISLVPALVATLFAARIVERLPLSAFGIGFHRGWKWNVALGLGIAVALLASQILGTFLFGESHIDWTADHAVPGELILTLGMLVVAAAFEELIFRGYPLQVLMKGMGAWPAILAMSIIFGLLHAQNPQSSPLGVFNTIVAGIMLSLAYLKTRSLWLPYGLHLGWNVALGMIMGFPLSGMHIPSLWTTHVTGSSWLLGGEYGPEGGLLGTLIFLGGAVAVWKIRIRYINYDDRFYKDARAG